MSYDVVVVGGGAAGCVLAARLSEDAGRSVLLLEAGPDYRADRWPAELRDGGHGPHTATHDWGLRGGFSGNELALPRGKVIGGCSATNATFALRGSPADFDSWGIPGWTFADVAPSFVALERDLDFGDAAYHGDDGPIPIRRHGIAEQSAVAAASAAAMVAAGIPAIPDHNAPGAVGVGPLPVNTLDGQRISTALAYLEPARARPNLCIRGDAAVSEVLLRGTRAVGVRLEDGEEIGAGEVVLAAGTYLSPRLLHASGVAPPGTGASLIDHPAVSIDLPYFGPVDDCARFQLVATLYSSHADPAVDPPDLQLLAGGPFPPEQPDAPPVFFLAAALLRPRSRGRVDADGIDLNYYDHPDDLARLCEGLDRVEDVLATAPITELTQGRRLTPRLVGRELREWIPAHTWSYHHPVGTCALGVVVDEQCRVRGAEGLSVVDASVLPDIPSANTHIPTIMLAERVAAMRAAEG